MTWKFDGLVYASLGALIIVTIVAAALVGRKDDGNVDLETRKVRFAAATFTGIMLLFVFAASLYFDGEVRAVGPVANTCPCSLPNAGKDIFDKGLTAMFTLAGSIVGYLFGTAKTSGKSSTEKKLTE